MKSTEEMRKSNSTDVSPCLQYTWRGGQGVGDSEMDEAAPAHKQLPVDQKCMGVSTGLTWLP